MLLGLKWVVCYAEKLLFRQAMRIAVPPLSNVCLILIKGTAFRPALFTVPENISAS